MTNTQTYNKRLKALGINVNTLKTMQCPVCDAHKPHCHFDVQAGVFRITCRICDETAHAYDFITAIYHFNWRSAMALDKTESRLIDAL